MTIDKKDIILMILGAVISLIVTWGASSLKKYIKNKVSKERVKLLLLGISSFAVSYIFPFLMIVNEFYTCESIDKRSLSIILLFFFILIFNIYLAIHYRLKRIEHTLYKDNDFL